MSAPVPDPLTASSPEELSGCFAAALARGDVEGALDLWIEDAAIITAGGESVRGREAIGAALTALVANGTQVEIEVTGTHTAGDVALVTGSLTLSGTDADGAPFRQQSSSAVVYARGGDGRWRVAIDAPWGLPTI
jgi:uncharacterized protein (TIGR02246 family)